MKTALILTLVLLLGAGCSDAPDAPNAPDTPYAGEQTRSIKALADEEIQGYLTGEGMGLAKAAELNHYPGPKHVLALAGELALTDEQRDQTQRIFEAMQEEALPLGRRIVENEQALDALFAGGEAGAREVRDRLRDIGALQAELRFVHLNAHLKMRDLLTADQVERYDQLRGYDATAPPGQHHDDMHHVH